MSSELAKARYMSELKKMQTGVGFKMQFDSKETEPKHLRVGVNNALVLNGALSRLLVAKGIITDEEYYTAMADGMQDEREKYERTLAAHYKANVTLGEAGFGQ